MTRLPMVSRYVLVSCLLLPAFLRADTAYWHRVLFDNSLTADRYSYSSGKPSAPSFLALDHDKLPVNSQHFVTGPNSLQLKWKSMPAGGWVASIDVPKWRNRDLNFPGRNFYFWCYSEQTLNGSVFPHIVVRDASDNFSEPLNISSFVGTLPARQWTRIAIPLNAFRTASIHPLDVHGVEHVIFVQGVADETEHSLLLDELRIDDPAAVEASLLPAPTGVTARGYERHIDIAWSPLSDSRLDHYVVYRAVSGQPFQAIGLQEPGVNRFTDFLGSPGRRATYRVTASDHNYLESTASQEVSAETRTMTDDELLTMVQEACFRYYWDGAHPVSGTTRENIPGDDRIVATGASGFGVMALLVGVDRSFITRQQGTERLLKILDFLEHSDRYHGAWPHFLDGNTGKRLPVFGMYENGGDLVETAFLMEGLLAAREYFNASTDPERALHDRITKLWESVEWDWYRRSPDSDALYWHWSPEYSWYINHRLTGWNEVMITYLLAIAAPTHGVPASLYYTGWAGQSAAAVHYRQDREQSAPGDHYTNGTVVDGIPLAVGTGRGGPLFFTQYSFLGFDPRGIHDRFADYFQNNRAIALINRAYCIANPGHYQGYGADNWGLTASDDPWGYTPHEPAASQDNGTMTPTGALASFPYTPRASMDALKHFYRDLGDRIWGVYGFRDAFNLDEDWVAPIFMGLNQSPIVVMIENYRTGLVWKAFMKNPEIALMLQRIGFEPDAKAADTVIQ